MSYYELLTAFYCLLPPFPMSTTICPHCGITGHQRRNHLSCLANPSRTATRAQNEAELHRRSDDRVCPHCGLQGHQRRNHGDCLNNPTRNPTRNEENEVPSMCHPLCNLRVCIKQTN